MGFFTLNAVVLGELLGVYFAELNGLDWQTSDLVFQPKINSALGARSEGVIPGAVGNAVIWLWLTESHFGSEESRFAPFTHVKSVVFLTMGNLGLNAIIKALQLDPSFLNLVISENEVCFLRIGNQ